MLMDPVGICCCSDASASLAVRLPISAQDVKLAEIKAAAIYYSLWSQISDVSVVL